MKNIFSPISRRSFGNQPLVKTQNGQNSEISHWKAVWYTREARRDMGKNGNGGRRDSPYHVGDAHDLLSFRSINNSQKTWGQWEERSLRKPGQVYALCQFCELLVLSHGSGQVYLYLVRPGQVTSFYITFPILQIRREEDLTYTVALRRSWDKMCEWSLNQILSWLFKGFNTYALTPLVFKAISRHLNGGGGKRGIWREVEMSTVLSLLLRSQMRQTVGLEPYEMANSQPVFGPPTQYYSDTWARKQSKQSTERLPRRIRADSHEEVASSHEGLEGVGRSGLRVSQPSLPWWK